MSAPAADPSRDGCFFSSTGQSTFFFTETMGNERTPRLMDPMAPEYFDEIAKFYLEAARRLPIDDIPDLARCISRSGLAVGLCDPVTNILLTTISTFAKEEDHYARPVKPSTAAVERTRDKFTFADGARKSRMGLVEFMLCYFRYLMEPQAKECLAMAGHDLPLALMLVQQGCFRGHRCPLLPDAARTKAALKQAAYHVRGCSAPDELVRLMTSRYPHELLDPVLDALRGGERLSADCVHKICDLLLHPWSPPPTPALTPSTFRDGSGNATTIISIRKELFPTITISEDRASTTIIASTRLSHDRDNLTGVESIVSVWRDNPDFIPFLWTSLLDTMHGLYMEALSRLPTRALREGHIIRAVLAAGHCYGPMNDPVSNIMFNSIWYDAVFRLFPLLKDVSVEVGAADILDPRFLSCVESCSLKGIVAQLCSSPGIPSEQHAVLLLCRDHDKPQLWGTQCGTSPGDIAAAALAAKHPQPAAYEAFLSGLSSDELDSMRSLMPRSGSVLSDDALVQLKTMIRQLVAAGKDIAAAQVRRMAPVLCQSALETLAAKRSAFTSLQGYVRTKLEQLLRDYGHSEGQRYQLGVICGVTTNRYYTYTNCFHVNFLASTESDDGVPGDATCRSSLPYELFFAEFWNQSDQRIEESAKPPMCCPVPEYPAYLVLCLSNEGREVLRHGQADFSKDADYFDSVRLLESK
ncbi:hypothetical protein CFC21_072488 [Triticum aestivum]|uniref:Uncharacterized protein n=2 Tax=Triticum aestivum TaxID=4565 RepID=A0A3B6LPT4_WHEAT|nr:hypothetical protein CFC21_072488 [Triticum aestivum]